MKTKLENFKEASLIEYPQATDLIFTTKELTNIGKNQNVSIPGCIWKDAKVLKDNIERIMLQDHAVKYYYNLKMDSLNNIKTNIIKKPKLKKSDAVDLVVNNQTTINNVHHEAKTFELSKLKDNEVVNISDYIPQIKTEYIRSGLFSDISKILKTERFFPIMISGVKGCGKTMLIEQAAARLQQPAIRINITSESDESKLIGCMNLIDGNTVWTDGPVIKAMKHGMILILDEIDLGGDKLMCLQSILEGSNYINKKTGEVIKPKTGFTIVMTSNTIGSGNITGKYAHTQLMNSAMIDRIKMTFLFEKPTKSTEFKILKSLYTKITNKQADDTTINLLTKLTEWSDVITKAYKDDIVEEAISTRKLTFILESYLIFNDIEKCIINNLNNFGEDDKESMLSLWHTTFNQEQEQTCS